MIIRFLQLDSWPMEVCSLISADLLCVRKGAQLRTKPFFFAVAFLAEEEKSQMTQHISTSLSKAASSLTRLGERDIACRNQKWKVYCAEQGCNCSATAITALQVSQPLTMT